MINSYRRIYLISSLIVLLTIFWVSSVPAGDYANSAHGNNPNGVNRDGMETGSGLGYEEGNCAHCHEQHASIEGDEPAPSGSAPENYTLFYPNFVNQTDGVCLRCHVVGGDQVGAGEIVNRSYSYRAGALTPDFVNDISTAFNFTVAPQSSHTLSDILTFIQGKAWGYTANSNPCVACHNPHAVQGDPFNLPNSAKTGARGWPLSRPSEHTNSPWDLWGDDWDGTAGAVLSGTRERMINYTANYQAPYRVGAASLEPIGDATGSPTTASQNTTDFVTFCTDCHNPANTILSTPLGPRNLFQINWPAEKHGGIAAAANTLCGDAPYGTIADRVLSCLDCHESHGSANAYILRPEVNGAVLGGAALAVGTPPGAGSEGPAAGATRTWSTLCNRCHQDDNQIVGGACVATNTWFSVHHDPAAAACSADAPINLSNCGTCHATGPAGPGPWNCSDSNANGGGVTPINCDGCHFHGASYTVPNPPGPAATHTTF